MKIFSHLFSGLLIGGLLALVIYAGNQALLFGDCSLQMCYGITQCDMESTRQANEKAEAVTNCEGKYEVDYKTTSLYSVVICGGIGLFWGICATISDASAAHRKRVQIKTVETAMRNQQNTKIVKAELLRYIEEAETEIKKEAELPLYQIQYETESRRKETDNAYRQCMQEREKLKQLLENHRI